MVVIRRRLPFVVSSLRPRAQGLPRQKTAIRAEAQEQALLAQAEALRIAPAGRSGLGWRGCQSPGLHPEQRERPD